MHNDYSFYRLKFALDVLDYIHKASDGLQQDLVNHGLDYIKTRRRFRMLAQLGQYQQQIMQKIPNWHIESPADLEHCLTHVQHDINRLVDQSS